MDSNATLPDAEALVAQLAARLAPALSPDTALVGIYTGGAWLAERLHRDLKLSGPLGSVDVSFYRDDYASKGLHPQTRPSAIAFDVAGQDILLVDDVLFTGRTIRAALNEIFDYGRPARVRLAALVDRGGRELPVAADFIGTAMDVDPTQMLALYQDDAGRLAFRLEARREP